MTKLKVPRRIAGVKVPRKLRRTLRDLAGSSGGKAALGDALAVLGAALASRPEQPPKARGGGKKASRGRNGAEPVTVA